MCSKTDVHVSHDYLNIIPWSNQHFKKLFLNRSLLPMLPEFAKTLPQFDKIENVKSQTCEKKCNHVIQIQLKVEHMTIFIFVVPYRLENIHIPILLYLCCKTQK